MSTRDAEERPSPLRAGSFLTNLLPGLASLVLIFAAPLAFADDHAAAAPSAIQSMMEKRLAEIPSGEEGVNRILGDLTTRLTLTEEQQKDIRPIVEDSVAQMEKVTGRFRAGEITPMALGMQLQMSGQKASTLIEPLLTEEQVVEYKAMRQEQRRQMMKAMNEARAAQARQAREASQ